MKSYDMVIVGGGIVGMAAALSMARRNYTVAVVDAQVISNIHVPNRVYAINQSSQNLLQKLNVWQQLNEQSITPYEGMLVWDRASKAHIEFDARVINNNRLGYIVAESSLKKALVTQSQKEGISFFDNFKVNQIKELPHEVQIFAKEEQVSAQLLMIADGATSSARELLQVGIHQWPYHQKAIVATVQTEVNHNNFCYQVFDQGQPLAFLPLSDPKLCSIVWSVNPGNAHRLVNISEEEFTEELMRTFAYKLGKTILKSNREQFPLHMRHAKQYSGARWMLLGDAAHNIHPMAGLGLNLGFSDIKAWDQLLEKTSHGQWTGDSLAAYQRQRKHAVWQIILMLDGLKVLFSNPLPPFVALRRLGLGFCNQFPLLKRFFISQAAGDL
jgi:2-octaprenylphenol hydroxylase